MIQDWPEELNLQDARTMGTLKYIRADVVEEWKRRALLAHPNLERDIENVLE
jgi:hypothetical protein